MPTSSYQLPGHLPSLDGLRGIAIALVLIHQLGDLETVTGFDQYLFRYLVGFGWSGVQLFFVLSGFLITGILLDTQAAPNHFSAFFVRRTLRIFPLYFATLIIAFVLLPLFSIDTPTLALDRPNQIWLWTYLENWAVLFDAGSRTFPHYWSLAVEEQFYLIWPFLLWRRSAEDCFRLCMAVAVASLLVRCLIAWNGISSTAEFYFPSICRADALALGGAAAALLRIPFWHDWMLRRRVPVFVATFVLLVVGALVTHGYSIYSPSGQTMGYTLIALIFALVATLGALEDSADRRIFGRSLCYEPLRALGKYSYAIYIFHKPLHDLVGKPLQVSVGLNLRYSLLHNVVYILVVTFVLFVLAYLIYHLFEKHFLRMKARYAPLVPEH